MKTTNKQRLSKVLANAGIASRRACEDLIFAGRVMVNGKVALLPQTMVGPEDKLAVNNKPVGCEEAKVYYLLNKPTGYVCSTAGNAKSKLVLDLFKEVDQRLFTVGRLDKDTSGLLIVTNDGHFANRVIHPSSNIHKEYVAKTDQEITEHHLKAISNGTVVEGVFIKPVRVNKVRKGTLKIVIAEGKKREIRVLLESVGIKVQQLSRIRVGGLVLGKLAIGNWRTLNERERELIFE